MEFEVLASPDINIVSALLHTPFFSASEGSTVIGEGRQVFYNLLSTQFVSHIGPSTFVI